MARGILETPKNRLGLVAGKFHTERLLQGAHLLYKRPEVEKGTTKQPGVWYVRLTNKETGKQKKAKIGTADDFNEADGLIFLSYNMAKLKAIPKLKELAVEFEEGILGRKTISINEYTVSNAVEDYLESLKRAGKKSYYGRLNMCNAHIIPDLGDIRVSRLTKERVEQWRQKLAETPKRKQIRKGGLNVESVLSDKQYKDLSPEEQRQRKHTANTIMCVLKTILNKALKAGKTEITGKNMWNQAEYYEGVRIEKIMFLSIEEQKRLIDACDNVDFKNLVIGALKTGGRYQELTNLKVLDYDKVNGTIHFGPFGKIAGKQRYVTLDDEGIEFFNNLVAGKSSGDLIFTRVTHRFNATKEKRPDKNNRWAPEDQGFFMKRACKKAGIANFSFHGLRHTYASILVNKGVPLSYIAHQLGHSSISIVQKFYGHLSPSDMSKSIKAAMPKILD
jgi:integrase